MSYILDALTRSQRESELGQVPTPTSNVSPPPAAPPARTGRLLLLLTLLASALAATAYSLLFWQGENRTGNRVIAEQSGISGDQTPTVDRAAAPAPAIPPAVVVQDSKFVSPPSKPTASPATGPAAPVQPPSGRIAPALAPGTNTDRLRSMPAPAIPPAAVVQDSKFVSPPSKPTATPVTGPAPAGQPPTDTPYSPQLTRAQSADTDAMRQELLALQQQLQQQEQAKQQKHKPAKRKQAVEATPDETRNPTPTKPDSPALRAELRLPPAVYSRLPRRQLSVVAYSKDPQRRFVIVNSQKLTEGSHSKEGLTVEEIHQDSVTFSFEGYRFRDQP